MIRVLPWFGFILTLALVKTIPISQGVLFAINIWLLSMPHTFSTLARSDLRTPHLIARTLGILLFYLIGIYFLSFYFNFVLIFTAYFLWQQFHYAKQNFGVSRWNQGHPKATMIDHLFYLLIPFISILGLFSKGPQLFFQYMIQSPFPWVLSIKFSFLMISAITVAYLFFRPKQWYSSVQHGLLFSLAYLGIEEFSVGWLCLNVFHNLQYLKFMHEFERKVRFLILPIIFSALIFILGTNGMLILSLMLALNFTHYTLDAMIWKRTTS